MNALCDELIQLIFYELNDPGPLAHSCRRLWHFSQDAYIRSNYFLSRYGEMEAMYYALGRGAIVTERVLDILLASGAHLSRYLIQIAIHHYFHTQAHFIKTPWVRKMSFRAFTYFMRLAEGMYGEIPHGKGEDDGAVFMAFLKESRFPPTVKTITWEDIKEILEKYKFTPFSMKDPVMVQFPLVLAIEPRLLPYAKANGFRMDGKYRDFVFRKMFERPQPSSEIRADDIARNVRVLSTLDENMFVTRTVAAEVCMEAKLNDVGYNALKQLAKSGHLRFELSNLVEDLLKTFLTTRSLCNVGIGDTLRFLFRDFPSTDPAARLVILIVIFVAAENLDQTPEYVQAKVDALGVGPVTKKDLYNVLINPFVERYNVLLQYASAAVGVKVNGSPGMENAEVLGLMEQVALKCIEIGCKGKLMKRIYETFPFVNNKVMQSVVQDYQIKLEDVPSWEEDASRRYSTKLSLDFVTYGVGEVHTRESLLPDREEDSDNETPTEIIEDINTDEMPSEKQIEADNLDLGHITQETLTTMIRHDEVSPIRSRRRSYYYQAIDFSGKIHYPHEAMHVGRWARNQFGSRSSVVAIFMTHAIINENYTILHNYLASSNGSPCSISINQNHVPVTFKHFQILARLGRTPPYYLISEIEDGAEFYYDEHDYIHPEDAAMSAVRHAEIKREGSISSTALSTSPKRSFGRKRPRRSAAIAIHSYAVSSSDDESSSKQFINSAVSEAERKAHNLHVWIKQLSELLRQEDRKFKQRKKEAEKGLEPGMKLKVQKTGFLRTLTTNLRNLRKIDKQNALYLPRPVEPSENYSDDDGEYIAPRPTKRIKAI
ncbi:hypothetical protein BDQ17DRAFT_1343128 [Cyathus striatus]|nr:hypothetical protein BDQ17DRAFT_1343128 [Cyathus striatus]